MSKAYNQRTPKAKMGTPDILDTPLHPDVDALLWILARESARIALEDAQAYLDQGAPYGETKKGYSRWLKENREGYC